MPVEKELVELAFQLYDFLHKTGPRFFEELGKEPAEFVVFVVEQYPKPARATRSKTATRPTYPAQWIDSRLYRRQMFGTWLKRITAQLQHPTFQLWKEQTLNALNILRGRSTKRELCNQQNLDDSFSEAHGTDRESLSSDRDFEVLPNPPTSGSSQQTLKLIGINHPSLDQTSHQGSKSFQFKSSSPLEEINQTTVMPNQDIRISRENLALIVNAVRGIFQDNLATPRPPRPPGQTGPSGVNSPALFNHHDAKFHAAEVEFFDQYFDDKSTATGADIENTSRNTYF